MNESIKNNESMYPEITAQLLEMAEVDQHMRATNIGKNNDPELWKEVDSNNTALLKQIIEKIGWPTILKVGQEASEDAWLIAQHADLDVSFQKQCLELMKKESDGEVPETDIAYLYDRICVNEGRSQFYGTQFTTNEHGAYGPRPIEDPETVDERRKAIGLEPLAEYKKHLEKKYKDYPEK
jgi:hypothetical protein